MARGKRRATPRRRAARPAKTPETATPTSGRGALLLPLGFTAGLLLLSFMTRVQANPRLTWAFWGAAGFLGLWLLAFLLGVGGLSTVRRVEIRLRSQHYIQALVQIAVYAYWGWYWRPVYDMAGLILAQLAFAYAFDLLLAWTRREAYTLGFGPFPIILSVNLFLWFRDDWFYLQFLMIALGFLGKEFVRWQRDGRYVHIFNPSAFALGLFSLALLLTGTTELTWGQEIASTLTLAPRIYTFLFAVGLVVMYFFWITPVAGSAAVVLFGASALYSAVTGVPYFLDSEIPAAVFLGLHLLITDPSTSPRTTPGKVVFGVAYGVGVFVLYWGLGALGAPTFYDKLLCVPLLNLCVRAIDAGVTSARERGWPTGGRARASTPGPARVPIGAPARANLAHMAAWVIFFATMSVLGRADGTHTGDRLPFWEQACAEERRNACARLLEVEATYCSDRSAWACNELGVHYRSGRIVTADAELAGGYFARACELRFQPACMNLRDGGELRAPPKALDLRLLLREAGLNLMELSETELTVRACAHGWEYACEAISS